MDWVEKMEKYEQETKAKAMAIVHAVENCVHRNTGSAFEAGALTAEIEAIYFHRWREGDRRLQAIMPDSPSWDLRRKMWRERGLDV